MKLKRFFITTLLLLPLIPTWGIGHIVYICFDPSKCGASSIIEHLYSWEAEGPLYIYVQKKDNEIHKISSEYDLEEYAEYLRSVGTRGSRPSISTIDDFNKSLVNILQEAVISYHNKPTLVGEQDSNYSIEIIVPMDIWKDKDANELIDRLLSINELRNRCTIHIWIADNNSINITN